MNYIAQPLGDQAVRIEFSKRNEQISELCSLLSSQALDGVVDIVSGINSITIFYDYPTTDYRTIASQIDPIIKEGIKPTSPNSSRLILLPTLYGGSEFGPDLEQVARAHETTPKEIIQQHAGAIYKVTMLGFLPGFPYLTGLPKILHTPRLSTPRVQVEAGSVGIGGDQTGVYPIASPGGWNLIGRTPIPLFSPEDSEPFLLQQGDRLQFLPVSEAEYEQWRGKIKKDSTWRKDVIADEKD